MIPIMLSSDKKTKSCLLLIISGTKVENSLCLTFSGINFITQDISVQVPFTSFEDAHQNILYIYQITSGMQQNNQQETIKSKLHSFDIEENQYRSAELNETMRNTKSTLAKYHSFREISDWNDRYHIQQSPLPPSISQRLQEHESSDQFQKFAFLVAAKNRLNAQIHQSCMQTKERLCLSPIKMQFVSHRSKNRYKKEHEFMKRIEEANANKSFYELNYEPLSKLYKQSTQRRSQEHASHSQQLPILFPQHALNAHFPKTQRTSSILRLMKRNRQLREIQRKDKHQRDMFMIPG